MTSFNNIYIGFDRDGTLELPNYPLNEKLAMQLSELHARGAKLFIASGKDYCFLESNFKKYNLQFEIICAENGGHIVNNSQNIDHIYRTHKHDFDFFCQNIDKLKLPAFDDEPKKSIWTKRFFNNAEEAASKIRDFVTLHDLQLQIFAHPDEVGGVDVVPLGIDKINILNFIPVDAEIHFFGDAENDLSLMYNMRVTPYTMANGSPAIKECVRFKNSIIADTDAGHGVSSILNTIFKV